MLKKKKIFKILVAFTLLFFMGCSSTVRKNTWVESEKLSETWKSNNIQIGDIIVKNRTWDIMGWYGHVGIVVNDHIIGDFPQPYAGYQENYYRNWLYEDRPVIVLRYKNFTPEFKKAFLKNVEELKNSNYWITFNKWDTQNTYCSKYIWYLFYKTAQDLGYELNIDNDSLFLILPYDFLEDKNLDEVEIR